MPAARAPAALVVLISGTGRNLQAIIDAIAAGNLAAELRLVVSNRGDAYGLQRAEAAGIPTQVLRQRDYADRDAFDAALTAAIDVAAPDIVALAGFMRILGSGFVQHYSGRLINIHPSLLPAHKGLDTHNRVLAAGDARHGASVHFVTDTLDAGPVFLAGSIDVAHDDTATSLEQRVMEQVEQRIYPQALDWVARGRARFDGQRVWLDGRVLEDIPHVAYD